MSDNTFCTKCGRDVRKCSCPTLKDERIKKLEAENADLKRMVDESRKQLDMLHGKKFSERCYHALVSRAEKAEHQSLKNGYFICKQRKEIENLKNLCKDMAGALEEIAKSYKEPTLKRLVDMLLEKFKEVFK